ncbi:hypothetical protein D9M70_427000 [compost metagenome]
MRQLLEHLTAANLNSFRQGSVVTNLLKDLRMLRHAFSHEVCQLSSGGVLTVGQFQHLLLITSGDLILIPNQPSHALVD